MKSILIVDDNKPNLATARAVLQGEYRVIPVTKGQQALQYLENGECDVMLLDINMPEMDGFEVLERLRTMEQCRNLPVIFLTADHDAETETRCFTAGAADVITKPFVPKVMLSRIARALEHEDMRRSLAVRLEQKTQEAQQDALTGLWDRVYTVEAVNGLLAEGSASALMMIDIDNFKAINDSHGHGAGDEVLRMFADALRSCSAEEDVLCRLGGDEFVVFMKDAAVRAEIRERALRIIAGMQDLIAARGIQADVSVSIGIARAPEDGEAFAQLYNCADKALYHVKRNGKNSYHFFSDRLQAEHARSRETVEVKYLLEQLRRADSGQGTYMLDLDGFQCVYHFIQRNVDRRSIDVTALLFTLGNGDDLKAMDVLEKVAATYLRRSDVATRYSSRQLIALLMEVDDAHIADVAARIIDGFHQRYTGGAMTLTYDVTRIESRLAKRPEEA